MTFSQMLKKIMDEQHLTNYELAKKMDIHPSTIANWLNGAEPRKKTKALLAICLGVSEEYLEGKEKGPGDDPESEKAFFRLKKGLEPYDLDEEDADFLLTVFKAHKEKNK